MADRSNAKSIIFCLSRMCRALMPGDEESMTDEAIWETLPVSFLSESLLGISFASNLVVYFKHTL